MKERRLRRTPIALRIQQEHDADMGVISRQAHAQFNKGDNKWAISQMNPLGTHSTKRD